jgi:hypothetical protein
MKSLFGKRCFAIRGFSTDESSSQSKFGDFTQKIDEASLKAPIVTENEIKFDSKLIYMLMRMIVKGYRIRIINKYWGYTSSSRP